jgi:uncharacterized protein
MLFGAGCILLISRLEKKDSGLLPADVYYTRLIWLLVFGLINAFVLLWPGDILYSYAICGLLIFPFRKSSIRLLLFMVLFFMAITMLKSWIEVKDRIAMREKGVAALALEKQKITLTDDQKEDTEKWKGFQQERKVENLRIKAEKEIAALHKSYSEIWLYLLPINQKIESSIFYDELFFDVLIFIFLGMALYKLGLLTGERPAWLFGLFIVVGYTLGFGWGILQGHAARVANYEFFEFLKVRPFPLDLYQFHRACVSMGHLGVIVLLWKSGLFRWLLKPFASVGQMAFTNYLMQTVICTLIFYGYGFGYFGKLQRFELGYVVIGVWIFQLAFSEIWLRYFLFGPLEWVWRSLTYWKFQPFSRLKDGSTAAIIKSQV